MKKGTFVVNGNNVELADTDIVYPDNEDPLSRYNLNLDEAHRQPDGYWEVLRTIKQVVTFDNKLWFIREKSIKALDKSFEKANITTHKAVSAILVQYNGDFFSLPNWDGVQYLLENENATEVLTEEYHGTVESV